MTKERRALLGKLKYFEKRGFYIARQFLEPGNSTGWWIKPLRLYSGDVNVLLLKSSIEKVKLITTHIEDDLDQILLTYELANEEVTRKQSKLIKEEIEKLRLLEEDYYKAYPYIEKYINGLLIRPVTRW